MQAYQQNEQNTFEISKVRLKFRAKQYSHFSPYNSMLYYIFKNRLIYQKLHNTQVNHHHSLIEQHGNTDTASEAFYSPRTKKESAGRQNHLLCRTNHLKLSNSEVRTSSVTGSLNHYDI